MSKLFWVDVESSTAELGLGKLLEIAAIVTDEHLNPIGEFEAVIRYSPEEVEEMKAVTPEFVVGMHEATGLWGKLPSGDPLEKVEEDIVAFAKEMGVNRNTRMAGNSVRHDANMIEEYLPELYELLSFRLLDISVISYFVEAIGGKRVRKDATHNAMDDILGSIAEYEIYLNSCSCKG